MTVKNLKLIICSILIFVGFLNCEIGAENPILFPNVAGGGNLRQRAISQSAPTDVMAWDIQTLNEVTNQIFAPNTFGNIPNPLGAGNIGIPNGHVIDNMLNAFYRPHNDNGSSHIALARVVIESTNNNRYIYPIPHVFVSGQCAEYAIARWEDEIKDAAPANVLLEGLDNAIQNTQNAPITDIVKGIGDYRFDGNALCYGHSERAAILCLLYSDIFSLENFFGDFRRQPYAGNVKHIIIQIKVANKNGECGECARFLRSEAEVLQGDYRRPNIGVNRNFDNPVALVTFAAQEAGVDFNTGTYIRTKLGIAANIPVSLRVSNNAGQYLHCFTY